MTWCVVAGLVTTLGWLGLDTRVGPPRAIGGVSSLSNGSETMASLRHETDRGRTGWRIRFRDRNKRQRSIWLREVAGHIAIETKAHVENLVVSTTIE